MAARKKSASKKKSAPQKPLAGRARKIRKMNTDNQFMSNVDRAIQIMGDPSYGKGARQRMSGVAERAKKQVDKSFSDIVKKHSPSKPKKAKR